MYSIFYYFSHIIITLLVVTCHVMLVVKLTVSRRVMICSSSFRDPSGVQYLALTKLYVTVTIGVAAVNGLLL